MRIAFSLASAPALVKNTLLKPAGAVDDALRRFSAGKVGGGGAMVTVVSSCAFMAASTRGADSQC